MVKAGQAKKRGSGRRVGQIELLHSLSNVERGPASPPLPHQYMGQRYTRREEIKNGNEVVAHVTQFKYIDSHLRPLFQLRQFGDRQRNPQTVGVSQPATELRRRARPDHQFTWTYGPHSRTSPARGPKQRSGVHREATP